MGGSISIDSTPGHGATFLVKFVLDVTDRASEATIASTEVPTAPALVSFPNVRVLVAEDQPSGRNVIRRQLAKLNIKPTIVNDGREAFAAYLSEQFDLLITDCHMPNVSGFELARMIRRHEDGRSVHLPILALTANALHGEAEFCFAAGMDTYVLKPASLSQLSQKIGGLLGPSSLKALAGRPEPGQTLPVDFVALAELIGEDDEVELQSIVVEYLSTAGPTFAKAREALGRQDLVELAEACHAGKGSALNVCAGPLANAWRALEKSATDQDLKLAARNMDELESRFRELTEEVGLASANGTDR
jgi:CheY-like chemotaxis protein/HPt (histidine-containing phosphotransfer) domain-containing protein